MHLNDVYNTRAILRLGTRTQTLTYTGWLESGVVVDARATRSIRHVASCASTPRNVALPLSPPFLLSLASQLALPLSLSLSPHPLVPSARCALLASHSLKKERERGNVSLSLLFLFKGNTPQLSRIFLPKEITNIYICTRNGQILTRNSRDTRERFGSKGARRECGGGIHLNRLYDGINP